MAFCVDPSGAVGDHNVVHTSQRNDLGAERQFSDGNKYIYLKGVTNLVDGDAVVFSRSAYTAVRSLSTTPTTGQLAIAQSAVDAATKYGWFLVKGYDAGANIATHSGGAGLGLFLSGTAGRLTSTPATELSVTGAWTSGNAASNVGGIVLDGSAAMMGDISTAGG